MWRSSKSGDSGDGWWGRVPKRDAKGSRDSVVADLTEGLWRLSLRYFGLLDERKIGFREKEWEADL